MSGCEEIRPRLTAFLDGEVEDPDAIQAHLNECPECAKMLDIHRKVSRLTSVVPGLSPHSEAWTELETRLSRYSGGRLLALAPAAAVAAIAVILYIFLFSHSTERLPIGALARKIGLVRIKPFAADAWADTDEKHQICEGDRVRTGNGSAARVELAEGGHVLLDGESEMRIARNDGSVLHVELVSGRAYACNCINLCIEVGEIEFTGENCQCVVAIESGSPVVYVKSGSMNCWLGDKSTQVAAMQKLILDGEGDLSPKAIEDPKVFDWVSSLSD